MFVMDFLDDFVFGPWNLIGRGDGLIRGLIYRDMGYPMAIPRADKGGKYTANEVEAILKKYGVAVYGRTHNARDMLFRVKRRQARWAEYVLLHAGVELRSATFDRRNPGYVARHAPGYMPPAWEDRGRGRP